VFPLPIVRPPEVVTVIGRVFGSVRLALAERAPVDRARPLLLAI
jgi:hypothetical protein